MTPLNIVVDSASTTIVMTRDFNAPPALVFKAFTDPALVAQWWGPERLTTTVEQMDVRKGGLWRYAQHDVDGNTFSFNGVYHDIVAPHRLVYTFEFDAQPGHVLLETVTFEERAGGKTTMTDLLAFQTIEDRNGMIESGMEQGAIESWERFEALLMTL